VKIKTQCYNKLKFRVHTLTGNITLESFCTTLKQLHSSSDFNHELNAIWNISQAKFHPVLLPDVVTARDFVDQLFRDDVANKVAIVVACEVNHGLAAMFETLFKSSPAEIQIYHEIAEAMKWVAVR